MHPQQRVWNVSHHLRMRRDFLGYLAQARQPRKKVNSLEPTLALGYLHCKFLAQCSLQTCSIFLYEVQARSCSGPVFMR